MSVRFNIWKLYAIRFLGSLIPAYVIERLFWEARGMTVQMVVYTEIIFALTIVLFEVPTGIIADKFGRKRMLVVAAILGCCEFLILVFATQFWHFALVVFLAAIGAAASSGAQEAMLYDTLASTGNAQLFEKYVGRMNALDLVSTIIAALCGSVLANRFGFAFNYWLSLVSMLVCFTITLLLVEPAASSEGQEEEEPLPIRVYVSASWRYFRQNKGVLLVVLSGMVSGAAINFIDEFWQLYLDRLAIPVIYFGLFSAVMFLLRLPGNLLAYWLIRRFGNRQLLLGVLAMLAVCFVYISVVQGYSSLAAIGLICLSAGVIEPLAAGYLHHRIDSAMRSTMGSFQSLGENAVLIAAGLGFGYLSSKFDIFGGYGFIAALCCGFFVYFIYASKKAVE